MDNFNRSDDLITARVNMVNTRAKPEISPELFLSKSGMAGVSIYPRTEPRARLLYHVAIGITAPKLLETALADFLTVYPLFRWSELAYRFRNDLEQEMTAILHRHKYASRYLEQEKQYVWSPKSMWTITVQKYLRNCAPLGAQLYIDYLFNHSQLNPLNNLRMK